MADCSRPNAINHPSRHSTLPETRPSNQLPLRPVPVAGPKHAYYRDVDGSLTGTPGATVLGAYTIARDDSLIDQVRVPGPLALHALPFLCRAAMRVVLLL